MPEQYIIPRDDKFLADYNKVVAKEREKSNTKASSARLRVFRSLMEQVFGKGLKDSDLAWAATGWPTCKEINTRPINWKADLSEYIVVGLLNGAIQPSQTWLERS